MCTALYYVISVLQEAGLLKGRVQLIEVPSESVLGLEGDLESCVYFIATGKLKVYRHTGDGGFHSQVHGGVLLVRIVTEYDMLL